MSTCHQKEYCMSTQRLAWALAFLFPACLVPAEGAVDDAASPTRTDGGLEAPSETDATSGAGLEVSAPRPEEVASAADATASEVEEPRDAGVSEVVACLPVGGECHGDEACCSGICTDYGEHPGYCIEPVVEGAFCEADYWCRSGRCAENTCIPVECIATGQDCRVDAACCSGVCSYMGVYTLETTCIEPRLLGEACAEDNWCQSGFCVNGLCAVGACLAEHSDCSFNDEARCCYPLFCSWRGDYAPGYCTAPQPPGASCLDARWCQSGACSSDGVCQ
jgi:hypothetical protein